MKKILFLALSLLPAMWVMGLSYTHLSFEKANGEVVSLKVDELSFTFENGILVAVNADGTQSLSVADLSKMYFSGETADVEDADKDDPVIVVNGLQSVMPLAESVAVYGVNGQIYGQYSSVAEAKEMLPKGQIFILRTNKGVEKTIRR